MIEIVAISIPEEYKAFVEFPFSLYKNHPYWVPPIKAEELETINKDINPVLTMQRLVFSWPIKTEKIAGRIAAIINWIEVEKLQKQKVRFGWFDVVDDIEVTKALINAVKDFGKEHNMCFMEGPVGFSNLDKAGLLVEGFNEMNTMITNYNYPYYETHMKELKMQKLAQWVEYEIKISSFEDSPEKVRRFGQLMLERYNLKVIHFKSRKRLYLYVDQMFVLLRNLQ